MTNPKAHELIAAAVAEGTRGDYQDEADGIANAIIGALAVGGFAIVAVDANTMQRVVAETSKNSGR